ncbi:MAG: hypothetical protein WA093_03100 [Minisyncoccales bacterium]
MDGKITTFAAIKLFYETDNNLIDIFGKLVVLVISKNEYYSINEIQKEFLDKINFNIPTDILQTIIKKLRKQGFIEYGGIKNLDAKSIRITDAGKKSETEIRKNFEIAEREKNALIEGLCNYIEKLGKGYSKKIIDERFKLFIENHNYIPSLNNQKNKFDIHNALDLYIVDYFSSIENSDPDNFERLKTVLYGSIISDAFLNKRLEKKAKINNLNIYLDTNIVFSLMGLHDDFYNIPAKEVVELIKDSGCSLKIFSFTKDEISKKLQGYINESGFYSSKIRVNSIYYTLKRLGYTKFDVISLISNIDQKIKELGIEIDYSFYQTELLKDENDQLAKLETYKINKNINSIKHDLAAILAIANIRKHNQIYLWEKARAIFLSNDAQLVSYDFCEFGHKTNSTFPEAVYRSVMAGLLWLKGRTGSDDVFMHNFFANYLREKVINTNLWQRFIDEVIKRKDSGIISQENIDEIISYGETERILREKGESGINEILDDYKIQQRQNETAEKDRKIAETDQIIKLQIEQNEHILNGITNECKTTWNTRINFSVWFIACIIIIFVIAIVIIFGISLIANILAFICLASIITIAISITQKKEFKFLSFLMDIRNDFENKKIIVCIENKKKIYGMADKKNK